MNVYQPGQDVSVSIDLKGASGATLVPTALSWTLLDGYGNLLSGPTDLAIGSPASPAVIVIPGAMNVLPSGASYASRQVDLQVTTASGVVGLSSIYVLRKSTADILIIPKNSFVTLAESYAISLELPKLTGFTSTLTSDDQRVGALMESYRRLTRFGYFVRWPRDPDAQNTLYWYDYRNEIIVPRLWQVMTLDRYLSYYPEDFRAAMRKAQITEADAILTNDPAKDRRNAGVLAETVGQSKIMFRDMKPLDLGLSRETLNILGGYIDIQMTTARV